jgi:hypothetical protein
VHVRHLLDDPGERLRLDDQKRRPQHAPRVETDAVERAPSGRWRFR